MGAKPRRPRAKTASVCPGCEWIIRPPLAPGERCNRCIRGERDVCSATPFQSVLELSKPLRRPTEAELAALRKRVDERVAAYRAGRTRFPPRVTPQMVDDLREINRRLARLESRIEGQMRLLRTGKLTAADRRVPFQLDSDDSDSDSTKTPKVPTGGSLDTADSSARSRRKQTPSGKRD